MIDLQCFEAGRFVMALAEVATVGNESYRSEIRP
jgi:hypothetical protein